MASIKKYNGSSFENAAIKKYSIATDTITTLPADLYADGNNATVGLKGNMSQTGTPTPQNPIQPSETGERTGNLLAWEGNWNGTANLAVVYNPDVISTVIDVTNITQLYFTGDASLMNSGIYRIGKADTPITSTGSNKLISYSTTFGGEIFDVSDCNYLLVSASTYNKPDSNRDLIKSTYMCNSGSQPLPYEPYGYKIPISSANTTTPVYLGEVQSTRKVKKLVLTGEEAWQLHPSVANLFRFDINDYLFSESNITLCTHYKSIANTDATGVSNGETCFYYGSSTARIIYIKDENISTAADFKTYLQQQYAAGTPVCVWYVLETETTGIVNEPLRKIGDYADTVSGITTPTTTGNDTFDVLTTLKPSEVELTYTGWHDASVKEWDGSQWQ